MSRPNGVSRRLTPFFAVVTLPLGILAFMFLGLEAALAVFVVGWLLLVPAAAVLTGPVWGPTGAEDLEQLQELQELADELDGGGSDDESTADPVEKLRDRYASGDIDEAELERRLEALLETEDLDPTDEAALERAVENVNRDDGEADAGLEVERE